MRKNTVIIIALVRIFGGAPASLAGSHAETAKRRGISRGRDGCHLVDKLNGHDCEPPSCQEPRQPP
jgi:hypothetical protein